VGNNHPRPIRFRQSPYDFPCTVDLGGEVPSWGLSRWAGSGLRFQPSDNEGFSLRGDRRQLLYKGRKRSHRFTILGDSSFEYDCILNREPDSNVIALVLEGAEQFDFLRQPEFIKDPLLAGSYAVYKKQTLIGEGTGKLCHIHRPKIIDARGRWVWGDLSIIGNRLLITIPESWLSEAQYPVIVDPTIGTTTVGSQTHWDYDPPEPWGPVSLECEIAFNQFTVMEAVKGICTAYFYAYSNEEPDSGGYPIIFDDNGYQPVNRLTKEEQFLDLEVSTSKPAGWRNTTFKTKDAIPAGSKIWFGLYTEYFAYARFDYGAKFYSQWNDDLDAIPDTLRIYSHWSGADDDWFKISWYFTYTAAQNYIRTLTQGVTLKESRKFTGAYKRTAIQAIKAASTLQQLRGFYRKCIMNVQNSTALNRYETFFRTTVQQIKATMGIGNKRDMTRKLVNQTAIQSTMTRKGNSKRIIAETGQLNMGLARYAGINLKLTMIGGVSSSLFKALNFFRGIVEMLKTKDSTGTYRGIVRFLTVLAGNTGKAGAGMGFKRAITSQALVKTMTSRFPVFIRSVLNTIKADDYSTYSVIWLRRVQEQETALTRNNHISGYIRGLYEAAVNIAEPKHTGIYYRKQTDTAHVEAISLRHLIIFIKLVTVGFVRDYLIRRFLKSNEELVLKSSVCKELEIDSRIH
jgi:hypothetical protein